MESNMRTWKDILLGTQPTYYSVQLRVVFAISFVLSLTVYVTLELLWSRADSIKTTRLSVSKNERWIPTPNHTIRSVGVATTVGTTEPWRLHPRQLEEWFQESLDEETGSDCSRYRQTVDNLIIELRTIFSSNRSRLNVDRLVKGGSFEKGTAVKGRSDVDLIAFLAPSHLPPILEVGLEEYRRRLSSALQRAAAALGRLRNVAGIVVEVSWLTFTRFARIGRQQLRPLTVDLVLTADNHLGVDHDFSEMFNAMLEYGEKDDQELHNYAMVDYQLNFVRSQPSCVKALVRLVKYWMYAYLPDAIQGSFRMELITIMQWQRAGRPDAFSKAQGLKGVLQSLANATELVGYWTYLYDASTAERVISRLGMKRPIILNPAIPTQNVFDIYQKGNNMGLLRIGVEWALQTQLLRDVVVRPNWMD